MEKRAQQRIYEINPEAMLDVEHWAREMRELWDERFDALDRVLEAEKKKAFADREQASSLAENKENEDG
jgi:hypothetical protein